MQNHDFCKTQNIQSKSLKPNQNEIAHGTKNNQQQNHQVAEIQSTGQNKLINVSRQS